MKLHRSNSIFEQHGREASVLVIVLWISIGLISIALYFANSMTYELRASDNRVSGQVTQQAIEGAARYVGYALYNYSTNGSIPTSAQISSEAVPVGDAHFWIIGRNPAETPSTDPYFGLIDEGSKLNLNTASTNTLYYLPNITTDFADAIVDWRSTNGGGMDSMDYSGLGYDDKNAAFETDDELRLVYGATMDLLFGNDLNQNGVLDAGEKAAADAGAGGVAPGLLEYFTVYSREPNFITYNDSTVLLTNVNNASEEDMRTLFESTGVASTYLQSIDDSKPNNGYAGMLAYCVACKTAGMSSDDFAKISPYITTSTSTYIRGRVNINSADSTVLTTLFEGVGINSGVDQSTAESAAQTILSYRQQNPGNLNSVAWIVDALGATSPVIKALQTGDFITTHSYQFTADIAAVGPLGRGYRRVKFVFDTSNGTPQIIYRQDLSRLGWALGDKVRQTWVANANATQ